MSKVHTATPWVQDKYGHACSAGDGDYPETISVNGFALSSGEEAKANTEFIVRACNSHDALVHDLRWAVATLGKLALQGSDFGSTDDAANIESILATLAAAGAA